LEDVLRGWGGEFALSAYDEPTGSWMFVAVHSTRLGPAAGGTRMKTYPGPADALRDATRLAGAMTLKMAVAGLPMGGGKSVLAVPGELDADQRRHLLLRHAHNVHSLGGNYRTGPDMNTSSADMDVLGEVTPYAFGRSPDRGGSGSSAPDTAVGVFHGIKASVAHVFGSDELAGKRVLVQGVGAVGEPLTELLAKDGAAVSVSDVDPARVATLAERLGVTVVDPGAELETECDVFAPCATGGVLSRETIPRLRCRVIAGAANNQLAEPEDADRLAERGILYAPDYVVNAGGMIHLASLELLGEDVAARDERLRGIGDTLAEVFALAERRGVSTAAAADAIVEERLAAGRT
jgi:leucine dehydrogenase